MTQFISIPALSLRRLFAVVVALQFFLSAQQAVWAQNDPASEGSVQIRPTKPLSTALVPEMAVRGVAYYHDDKTIHYDEPLDLATIDVTESSMVGISGPLTGGQDTEPSNATVQDPNIVIGIDQRTLISNTTSFPWRTISKMIVTFPDGATGGCTGTIISRNNLLTAGHCVYDSDHGGWATKIEVIPGYDNEARPFGTALSRISRTTTEWINSANPNYDYALLTLDRDIGNRTGWMGYQYLSNPLNVMGYLAGYPGDLPLNVPEQKGKRMYLGSGPVEDFNDNLLFYTIDTFNGQSGSGIYRVQDTSRFIIGVHHGGDESRQTRNQATRINNPAFTRIKQWVTEDAAIGYVESLSCKGISGWAADRNKLNTPIHIEITDVHGSFVDVYKVLADRPRTDVGSHLGDNGLHGFNYTFPSTLASGPHQIKVKVEGAINGINNSPQTLSCSGTPNYVGHVDWADCNSIGGWAADRNRLGTSINVSIYDGATLLATVPANQSRPDVGNYLKDTGLHGFNIPTPAALRNGAHSLSVKFESSPTNLASSPKALSCSAPSPTPMPTPPAAPSYAGYVDWANCNSIGGWAADRNRLGTSINVSIYDGATLLATVPANQSRPDVGSYLKDTGLHGFSIPTPSALKSGAHTLSVRFESSGTNLIGSPKALTCSSPTPTPMPTPPAAPSYAGYVDWANCNSIGGWAADRKRLGTSINVSIYDGATLLMTVPANQARPDVGDYLKDNGVHGFNIPTPAALRNGQAHSVSVRFESSASSLAGSPKIITCSTSPPPTVTGYSWNATPVASQPFGGTVSGTNFVASATQVWFCVNGSSTCYQHPSAGINVNGSGSLSISGINLDAGSWQLFVQTVAGQSARSSPFTVQSPPSGPTVTDYSWNTTPRAGQSFGGTVSGSGFMSGATQVWFCTSGSSTCYQHPSGGVSFNNAGSLSVSSVNLSSGWWQFYLVTPAGQSARSASFNVQPGLPTISSYSWNSTPSAGQPFGGSISGAEFIIGATQVWFCVNGSSTCYQHPSAGINVNNSTSLSVSGVNLSSGWWQIYLQTSAGQSRRSTSFSVR